MLEPLYTAEEMRAAEQGHDIDELMERAGAAVAQFVQDRFAEARAVTVVCGGGANGGDGRIAARLLGAAGREVTVVGREGAAEFGAPQVIVDALFGTGFSGAPREGAARLIEQMNEAGGPIVAVDLPSGVDASTGEVPGAAVRAAHTVTFHGPKVGLVVAPGRFHAGEVFVSDIGLEPVETEARRVRPEILRLVPRRAEGGNKYRSGSVLVVGGSPGLTGAVCLAAEAAFRADAGYVAVAVPRESLPVVEQRLLEAVKRPLDEVDEAAEKARAVALGPGLGRGDEQTALVRRLLGALDLPVVVDADALYQLEPVDRDAGTVLTPHSGELGRLLGEDSTWVDAHRLEAARRAAERFRAVCLLKGSDTIVASRGEGILVCDLGTPALATAGTGDVLTGIITAFLSKGMDARLAAAAGAAAQQLSARFLDFQTGVVAGDVIDNLPAAFEAVESWA
ncbi:MAG: NAD(P)H-hydrate dehydratase [Actinomycetota bacterium]|nr:NAD(P)H-hydrate dehydratase [Actinomycetota bacterium]